jgi:hypothetical protein
MGERSETPPTANPPKKRAVTKPVKLAAKAVAMDVTANSAATNNSSFLQHAAEQQRAECPTEAEIAQCKFPRDKWTRPRDDGNVEPK